MNDTAIVVLHYKNTEHFFQCLDSLLETPNCDFYVIENKSDTDITNEMFGLISEGKIMKYVLFEENIANNAPRIFFLERILDFLDYKYIVYTDGDVVPDKGWLEECKKALDNNKHLFVIGTDLYMDNLPVKSFPDAISWVPNNPIDRVDYFERATGCYCLTFRTVDLLRYLNFIANAPYSVSGIVFSDWHLLNFIKSIKKQMGVTKVCKAKHLVWDYYQDRNHPYTQERLNNPRPWSSNTSCKYEVFE